MECVMYQREINNNTLFYDCNLNMNELFNTQYRRIMINNENSEITIKNLNSVKELINDIEHINQLYHTNITINEVID